MANLQSRTLDPLAQSAIRLGSEQAKEWGELEEITLKFDELTKQKLKRLSSSMSLSIRTVIESAINYTYTYVTEQKIAIDDLRSQGLPQGDFPLKIVLGLETITKLERIGMSESISECAVIGINLLYDRLIPQDIVSHD